MLITCQACGRRFSLKWLFLALPWSKYKCPGCGAVYAGTILRLVLTSVAVGVVGYVLIAVIKGRMASATLVAPVALALAVLLLRLPGQIRKVE